MISQTTVLLVKPDGVRKKLVDAIRAIIEASGLSIVEERRYTLSSMQAREMYEGVGDIAKRNYFDALIAHMSSSDSHLFVVRGNMAITTVRAIIGKREPSSGIRAWWATSIIEKVAHAPHDEAEASEHLRILRSTT